MKLIIMRGLPGSGKSFRAKELAGDQGLVFSTDDFFMEGTKYNFDPNKLPNAHAWNQARVAQAMQEKHPLIVVDNTNTRLWEMQAYVKLADHHGYELQLGLPTTPWQADVVECAAKNTHGVPLESILKMKHGYETMYNFDCVRNAVRPF